MRRRLGEATEHVSLSSDIRHMSAPTLKRPWSRSFPLPPGNLHVGRAGGGALRFNPGDVFADSGYRGQHFASALIAKGGTPLVVQTSTWGRPGDDSVHRLRRGNWSIQKVRCRIEKIFGTWKRSYGLRRMRWRGLANAALKVRLTAIAYNVKRTSMIISMRP
jgi:IS5 family transposase